MTMDLPTSFPTDMSNTTIYEDEENSTRCPDSENEWIYSVVPVYVWLIAMLGIVLNILVLLVFCVHKKACNVAEIYLGNMAAADLLLMSFMPFWAINVANKYNWSFGNHMCRLVNLCIVMNATCSIYFLVLVSIDRFLALVYPLSHNRIRSRKCAKLGCLLAWCFGLVLSIPTLICRKVKHYPKYNVSPCVLGCSTTVFYMNEGIITVFSFIIPVVIISFCTVRIIQALNKRPIEVKKERKATILVLVVLLAFLICWMPFHLARMTEVFLRAEIIPGNDNCEVVRIVESCSQIFSYIAFFNSVLNPVLYVIVGQNFRDKMWEVIVRYSMKKASNSQATTRTPESIPLQSTTKKL